MRPDPGLPVTDPPARVVRAQAMAQALDAHIILFRLPPEASG